MTNVADGSIADIDRLFKEAQAKSGMQSLYTLVRVDGMQSGDGYEDEFLRLMKILDDPALNSGFENYQMLAAYPGPIRLLHNLLNCANGELYDVSPLRSLVKGGLSEFVRPTPREIVDFIVRNLQQAALSSLAQLFGLKAKAKTVAAQIFGDDHGYPTQGA